MLRLGLRTWPFMRPLLRHLITLLVLALAAIPSGFVTVIVGEDLLRNKVLVGDKLQPLQATVLLLGSEYVVTGAAADEDIATSSAQPEASADPDETAQTAASAERLTPAQRRTVRNRILVWTVIVGASGALIGFGVYYYSVWIWQSVNQNLRVAMVERVESLSLKHHDDARVGDAIFRVYQDSAMIVNLLQSGVAAPLYAAYGLLVALAIVAAFDPWFALLLVAVAVPMAWLAGAATSRVRARARRAREAGSDLVSRTQEALIALKVVKANGAEARVFDRFDQDSRAALNAAYFLRLDMTLVVLGVATLGGLLLIGGEYLMVAWILEQRETFLGAALAAFIGFAVWNYGAFEVARGRVGDVAAGARSLTEAWLRMQDLFIALERAFWILDLAPEVADPASPAPVPAPVATVAWRGVRFGYGSRSGDSRAGPPGSGADETRAVLQGVDLEASAGTVTAVVGATGAGKSTLMALLLRLFDPDAGEVTINGVDLRAFALHDLRANIAIALQKNVLFADSVAANIAFGAAKVGRDAIEAAARIAAADDFIGELPKGYDTELGERGGKLSAGQRQRISIARAVVRDTSILILDEPTAALDARTEQRVLTNLAAWARAPSTRQPGDRPAGRVVFLITHRISTIKNADQIAFIEGGRVAERGTHAILMTRATGRYRAFVEAETGERAHVA